MYGWIVARKLRPGVRSEYVRTWQKCTATGVLPDATEGGPLSYSLQFGDDPNEVWELMLFPSTEAAERYRTSHDRGEDEAMLAEYVEQTLWERDFQATQPQQPVQPLQYGVYVQTNRHHPFRLVAIVPSATEAIEEAHQFLARFEDTGELLRWTLRVYNNVDEVPRTLPANSWYMHEHEMSKVQ